MWCLPDRRRDDFVLSDESRLTQSMLERYRRAGSVSRPLLNSSHSIEVEFSLSLIQILDFDETNQVLTTNVWKKYVRRCTLIWCLVLKFSCRTVAYVVVSACSRASVARWVRERQFCRSWALVGGGLHKPPLPDCCLSLDDIGFARVTLGAAV